MSFFSNTWINGAARYLDVVSAAVSPYPDGDYSPIGQLYYPEPIGGSTALKRYQTNLDGQDDFWLAGFSWSTVSASSGFEYEVIGSVVANRSINDDLGTDGSGNIIWSNFAGETATLNGNVITSGTTQFVDGEINHIVINGTYSGSVDRHGTNTALTQFWPAAINAVKLVDGASAANSYTYKLTGNAPYELPIGEELGVELWSDQGSFTNAVGTVDGNSLDFTTSAAFGYYEYTYSPFIPSGSGVFEFSFDVEDPTGGTAVNVYDSSLAVDPSTNAPRYGTGSHSFITTIDSLGRYRFRNENSGVQTIIKNIQVRQIPNSALTLENGEPDGSDRELITRKSDNSGWIGESLNEYDYAAGSNQ